MGYNRYIFFSSCEKGAQLSASLSSDLSKINFSSDQFKNNSESLTYIKNFLDKIKAMASIQRSNQLSYIQNKFKDLNISDIYFKNNRFDYISFIKDLNLTMKTLDEFKQTLTTFQERINNINVALKQMQGKTYIYGKNHQQHIISKQRADQLYKSHEMSQYKAMIQKAVEEYNKIEKNANIQIGNTINREIAQQIPKIIKSIASNQQILSFIAQQIINGKVSTQDLKGAILHSAITFFRDNLKSDIKNLLTTTVESSQNQIKMYIEQGMNISYKNILGTDSKMTAEDFLKRALQAEDGKGLAKDFQQLSQNQVNKLNGTKMGQQIVNMAKELYKGLGAGEPKATVAKQKFSSAVRAIIQKQKQKIKTPITKKNIGAIFNSIKNDFINQNADIIKNIDINGLINQVFSIDSISGSTMAQIMGAVEALIKNRSGNVDQVFIPGDVIKLKNDFSFTYHINKIPETQFIKTKSSNPEQKLQSLIDQQGKEFLARYDQVTHGATNIKVAYDEYMKTLIQINNQRLALLKNAKNEKQRQKIQDILKNFLVNVSVKEYKFYNNTVGYGAGSLGGGGKVIEAVPQLLNMIHLGGITVPDAEAVINALLNSFPQSIIGTGYVEDLQNFLLVGAAMMLFDDGFTSGTVFLQQIQEQLDGMNIPSLHLMLLDGMYIPQSYILQNIYQNLTQIYQDILERFGQMAQGRTTNGAAASLVLHNNINTTILQQIQQEPGDPWENMSNYAQKNVTINYFFMAGMLDIVSSLGSLINL